jgi:hypothetical protein
MCCASLYGGEPCRGDKVCAIVFMSFVGCVSALLYMVCLLYMVDVLCLVLLGDVIPCCGGECCCALLQW